MAFENIHKHHDYYLQSSESARRTRAYLNIFPNETVIQFDKVLEIRYSTDTEKGVVRGASRLLTAGVLEDVTEIYEVLDEVPTHNHILTNSNFLHVLYGSTHLIQYLEKASNLSKSPRHMFSFRAWCTYAFLFSLAIGVLFGVLKPLLMHYVVGDVRMSPKMLIVVILETVFHLFIVDMVFVLHRRHFGSLAYVPLRDSERMGRLSVIRNRLLGFMIAGLLPLNVCIFAGYHFLEAPNSIGMGLRTGALAFFTGGFMFGGMSYVVERLTMFVVTGDSINNERELPYVQRGSAGLILDVYRTICGGLKKVLGFNDVVATMRLFIGRVFPIVFTYLISTFLSDTSLHKVRGLLPVVENTIFFVLLLLGMAVDIDLECHFQMYVANLGEHRRPVGSCFEPVL